MDECTVARDRVGCVGAWSRVPTCRKTVSLVYSKHVGCGSRYTMDGYYAVVLCYVHEVGLDIYETGRKVILWYGMVG